MDEHVIRSATSSWPARLDDLEDPPGQLWVRGDRGLLAAEGVAIIGTRVPEPAASHLARSVAQVLARRNLVVISGASPGVDTAVHRGVLDGGGRAMAVVPGGLDQPHDPGQLELVESIWNAPGGLVLTESPPGTPPDADHRRARDRLQAALARMVIVMQTEREGGAMNASEIALQLGREVVVIDPGSNAAASWSGNVQLLSRDDVVSVGINEAVDWAGTLR